MRYMSLFFAILYLCFGTVSAQDKIYFDAENPPFMYENNGAKGLYPALVKEIYKRINQKVICISVPWIRALSEIKINHVGIAGLYKNEDREKYLDFSNSIYHEDLLVYYKKSSDFSITQLSDLNGKKIGVIRGWSYGNYFDSLVKRKYFIVEENTSDTHNIKKLLNSRLDAVIAVRDSGDKVVKATDIDNELTKSKPILQLEVFIAFNKKLNKKNDINKIIKAISEINTDGTIIRIENEELNKSF